MMDTTTEKRWKTGIALSDEVKDRLTALGDALNGKPMTVVAALLLERILIERPQLAAEALAITPDELLAALDPAKKAG